MCWKAWKNLSSPSSIICERVTKLPCAPADSVSVSLFYGTEADRNKDKELTERIDTLQWVQPHHLDMPSAFVDEEMVKKAAAGVTALSCHSLPSQPCALPLFLSALTELAKMDNFKAPRDKIVCVLNCCKLVMGSYHLCFVGLARLIAALSRSPQELQNTPPIAGCITKTTVEAIYHQL